MQCLVQKRSFKLNESPLRGVQVCGFLLFTVLLSEPSVISKKSGKLKTGYKRDFVNLGCDVDLEGPIIHAAAVLGYEGWLAGYQMAFDTAKSKMTQNNFALGYRAGDFQLHTNV